MAIISIIIPVYNVENYLRRCLDSVLAQTFTDWEAICVNDGSPDNSAAILDEYAARDARFIIVSKENGGLSDARNCGLDHAKGKFVIYLDSDDFIHPQTMEIAIALQERNHSDIVSWYKDRLYRPQMFIRYTLGLPIDNFRPKGIKKRYNVEDIDTFTTDDVFAHVVENSHTSIKYPLKHFYVVRHLIRRDLLKGIEFIKGITFEDFPWWSEVILKNPRVTITQLPFYYYYPNFHSIDLSHKRGSKVKNWLIGLEHSYKLYEQRATSYQLKQWSKNCKWPVISKHIASKLSKIHDKMEQVEIKLLLKDLWEKGVFDDYQTPGEANSRKKIKKYIGV